MAKDSSFDIVSTVDLQEVDNAYGQAKKELAKRYDLKDSGSDISFDKSSKKLTVSAPSDFGAKQVRAFASSRISSKESTRSPLVSSTRISRPRNSRSR